MSLTNLQAPTGTNILNNLASGNPIDASGNPVVANSPGTPTSPLLPNNPAPSNAPAPAPIVQTSQSPTGVPAEASSTPITSALDVYKKPLDNDGKPVTSAPPASTEIQIPQAKDFQQISNQLAGQVKIDPELMAKASESPEGMTEMLNNFASQLINGTLHASALTTHHIGQQQSATNVTEATNNVNDQQYVQQASSAAIAVNPALTSGMQAKLLETAITELRAEYPTAPAELLGQEAAKQLGGGIPQADTQLTTEPMNWVEHSRVPGFS